MDSDQLNYLTILKPSVFKHLFKFLKNNDVRKARSIHKRTNEAFRHFKQYSTHENIGESALFEVHNAATNTHMYLEECGTGSFIDDQWEEMDLLRDSIQHLAFTSDCVLLERSTYDYLDEYLIGRTGDNQDTDGSEDNLQCPKSLQVEIEEDDNAPAYGFHYPVNGDSCSQEPSWYILMEKLKKERGITANLKTSIHPEVLVSTSQSCDLLSLPAEHPYCQHVAHLRFLMQFYQENELYGCKAELTAHPIAFFLAKLPVLQHLEMNVFNLSTALLEMFSRKGQDSMAPPLKTLGIYFMNSFTRLEFYDPLPEIRDDTWDDFAKAYPDLQLKLCLTILPPAKFETDINAASSEIESSSDVEEPNERGFESARAPEASGSRRERNSWIRSTDPPSTAGAIMRTVLKPSAPLATLVFNSKFTAEHLDDFVQECLPFCRTLQMIRVDYTVGEIEEFDFQTLTSEPFSMRDIISHEARFHYPELSLIHDIF